MVFLATDAYGKLYALKRMLAEIGEVGHIVSEIEIMVSGWGVSAPAENPQNCSSRHSVLTDAPLKIITLPPCTHQHARMRPPGEIRV